jgi:hypothetical protein
VYVYVQDCVCLCAITGVRVGERTAECALYVCVCVCVNVSECVLLCVYVYMRTCVCE